MRNELKFLLSFPFGQRLEMMQRLHQLHLKKVLSKHEIMGMNSLFRQHTHLIHVYSSPCQYLSGKDTGASHISQETIVRVEVDMTEYQVTHTHADRHLGQTQHAGTYPYCTFLSELTQQCWIPVLCKLIDPSKSPEGIPTSNPVSQHKPGIKLRVISIFKNSHLPFC